MPSPLGHVLGGIAAGWLAAGAPGVRRSGAFLPGRTPHPWLRQVMLFGALGAAPDLDLLVGLHSRQTHSVAAVALVLALAWASTRGRDLRWALGCGAALASHILLDWLGSDTTPPIGIMALWPFSNDYYQSSLQIFPAVSRRYWQWAFVTQNTLAAGVELAILGPIAWIVTRPPRRRHDT